MHDEDNYTQLFHPSQPDGYIGCYNDSERFSDLSGFSKIVKNDGGLPSTCREICKQFLYFGLQQGQDGMECRCSNEFGYYGNALDSECPHVAAPIIVEGVAPLEKMASTEWNLSKPNMWGALMMTQMNMILIILEVKGKHHSPVLLSAQSTSILECRMAQIVSVAIHMIAMAELI